MKDHEITALVNAIRDTAVKYHDHQSLRERVSKIVMSALKRQASIDTMTHLAALMDGLEIPNPEWYVQQSPEILRRVGAAIASQAKRHQP